jgi:alkanesulfonate monooxygenase SsuD/methylene tetrahydromethanopterin reductase-like flavin-dependent oxidoreductase (luciferase family)
MWGPDDGPFDGTHYQLAETICSPGPVSPSGIPILVGGNGEKKTLRLVARYADACNLMVAGPEDAAPKLEVLRRHCDAEGRDETTVEKTVVVIVPAFDDVGAFLRSCDDLAALGVDEVVVMTDGDIGAFVDRVGREIVPRLAS